MRIHHMATLSVGQSGPDSTLMLEQRFSHSHRRIRAAAMTFAGALICTPFAIILADQMARARLVELVIGDPLIGIKLGLAAAIGLTGLGSGLFGLLRRVVRERVVTIDREHALVEDVVRGRKCRWQEPLRAYNGVRHHVQTRSSGPVHILTLEHSLPARSLCIAYGTHIANQVIVEAGRRYNLPILSGRRLGIWHRMGCALVPTLSFGWGRSSASTTQPAAT